MLRSTITTGSYVLKSYLRSYPSNVSAQSQSQDLTAGQPEWQHFAHPVISLTLEVKKSMDDKFESVRLRVLWNMDMGHDGTPREMTMEDLDLLTFSGLDSQVHSPRGLPLKAVYKGTLVGIRYQYPLSVPATSPSSYRRFEVHFTSASDAAQFIDAIRPVCPCKAGPPPPQFPMSRLSVPRSATIQAPSASAPLVRHHTSAPQRPPMPPLSTGATVTTQRAAHYRSSQEELSKRAPHPPPSRPNLSLVPSSDAAPTKDLISEFDMSSQPSSALPEIHSSQFTAHKDSSTSSLPASSQPTSSPATLAASSQGPEEKTREAFLESLRGVTGLYDLSRQELENLVSTVVREPGFPKLLESLDSMWVSRGFLGR